MTSHACRARHTRPLRTFRQGALRQVAIALVMIKASGVSLRGEHLGLVSIRPPFQVLFPW